MRGGDVYEEGDCSKSVCVERVVFVKESKGYANGYQTQPNNT